MMFANRISLFFDVCKQNQPFLGHKVGKTKDIVFVVKEQMKSKDALVNFDSTVI